MPDTQTPLAAEWRQVSITFPYAETAAAGPVDITLRPGERVLLLGPSGSGKSSLLLALTGLIPASVPATVAGETAVFGQPSGDRSPADWADTVAHYLQDADQVLCGMRIRDEIAFALENRGLPVAEIERRIVAVMALLRLPADWLARRSLSLSGGERQLVALAAVLVQDAPILLADEPTAHLSPEAADRLHAILAEPGAERAVLVVDHRLDGLVAVIDRVVVLGRSGAVIAEGPPRNLFRQHHARLAAEGIWRPAASDLDALLVARGLCLQTPPLAVAEALGQLDAGRFEGGDPASAEQAVRAFVEERLPPARPPGKGAVVARLVSADCAPFLGPTVLRALDFAVTAGTITVLVGRNGAGKSTLGASLAGLLRLKGGRREGPPGAIAFQRPEDQFSAATVSGEVASMLPKGLEEPARQQRVDTALDVYGLRGLEDQHPATLSEGQKRRLVLAAIDAADRWPLLVLDEPTAGLDAAAVENLVTRLEAMRARGRALVLITHDMDLALRLGDRVAIVAGGSILEDGPAATVLLDAELLQRNGLREPAVAAAMRWLEARSC